MAVSKLVPSLLLVALAISTVYPQTFQYSRGWTNGKRSDDELRRNDKLVVLERVVENPCQFKKLKYILEGRPITDKIFMPCDFTNDDEPPIESHPRRPPYSKSQRSTQDQLYDNFL